MSYHPTILVYFSRVVLASTVFFSPGGRSADKRMALGWRSFVRPKLRMAVGCLSLWLDPNDYRRMLVGWKTQQVCKAYFGFVRIWISWLARMTNRMALGWSSKLALITSTHGIHRMALGWIGSWRLRRQLLSQSHPFFFFETILVPQNV